MTDDAAETNYRELHLGWHADKEPLMLDFRALCHHGAILAGSGAGKSTAVGRIVEEIVLKTDARVVVIDTNGDFRKAHLVADIEGKESAVWTQGKGSVDDDFSYRKAFEESWQQRTKLQLTYALNNGSTEGGQWATPYISWNKLPIQWKMDILGLELGRDPDEVAALYKVTQRLENEEVKDAPISPDNIRLELRAMATTASLNAPGESLGASGEKRTDIALQMRFRQADQLNIWRRKAEDIDLSRWFQTALAGDAPHYIRPQLCTFDVPSVSNVTSRNILVAFLLNSLWDAAQKDWENAVDDPSNDQRSPTFLVVDEAHNFVPAEDPMDPHALRISQSIQRIAAEGRKYGLFLLLATQRPSKVRPGLLSECENVCLLRLRSPIERGLAVETWALHEDHKHPRLSPLAKFDKGLGLLCGYWADWDEIPFKAGLRRTKATGGDLPETWIGKKGLPSP